METFHIPASFQVLNNLNLSGTDGTKKHEAPKMIRRLTCAIFLGFAGFIGGCSDTSDAVFSTRNAHEELDLHSTVRGQSNALLNMTDELYTLAQRNQVSPKKLDRELDSAASQVDQMQMNLPTLLAAQDVEIADLRQQVSTGASTKSALADRTQRITVYRKALLASIKASKVRTGSALNAMQAKPQTDQTQRIQALDADLGDMRSMIEMQL